MSPWQHDGECLPTGIPKVARFEESQEGRAKADQVMSLV